MKGIDFTSYIITDISRFKNIEKVYKFILNGAGIKQDNLNYSRILSRTTVMPACPFLNVRKGPKETVAVPRSNRGKATKEFRLNQFYENN